MNEQDPSTMTRRERRRQARRQEILDAAMRLVVEGGLDGLTMPRLAEELDAAVGALYRYFDSKDALIAALQAQAIKTFGEFQLARVEAFEPPAGASPRVAALARTLVAFSAYLVFADAHPERFQLVDISIADPRRLLSDEDARAVQAVLDPILQRCASLIEAAVEIDALGDGEAILRTFVLWGAMHGTQHFRKRDRLLPAEVATKRVMRASVYALLVGWGADSGEADAAVDIGWSFPG